MIEDSDPGSKQNQISYRPYPSFLSDVHDGLILCLLIPLQYQNNYALECPNAALLSSSLSSGRLDTLAYSCLASSRLFFHSVYGGSA